jgi:hypothetical protein
MLAGPPGWLMMLDPKNQDLTNPVQNRIDTKETSEAHFQFQSMQSDPRFLFRHEMTALI